MPVARLAGLDLHSRSRLRRLAAAEGQSSLGLHDGKEITNMKIAVELSDFVFGQSSLLGLPARSCIRARSLLWNPKPEKLTAIEPDA